jgi:hypothetical protein
MFMGKALFADKHAFVRETPAVIRVADVKPSLEVKPKLTAMRGL